MEESIKKNTKIRHSVTIYILFLCFIVSLVSIFIYFSEDNYEDSSLFALLAVIRYSSFFVIVCSFYKIILNFYRIFIIKRKVNTFKMILYFFLIIYGIVFFLFEAIIVVISRGNL